MPSFPGNANWAGAKSEQQTQSSYFPCSSQPTCSVCKGCEPAFTTMTCKHYSAKMCPAVFTSLFLWFFFFFFHLAAPLEANSIPRLSQTRNTCCVVEAGCISGWSHSIVHVHCFLMPVKQRGIENCSSKLSWITMYFWPSWSPEDESLWLWFPWLLTSSGACCVSTTVRWFAMDTQIQIFMVPRGWIKLWWSPKCFIQGHQHVWLFSHPFIYLLMDCMMDSHQIFDIHGSKMMNSNGFCGPLAFP